MVVGQPGAGKSTFAREIGAIAHLPVHHEDGLLWLPGWIERPADEREALVAEACAGEAWVFDGGRSSACLARADTLVWLDVALPVRAWRLARRTLRHRGRSRPELPEGCPDRFRAEFLAYVWRQRREARERLRAFYEGAPPGTAKVRLVGARAARRHLAALRHAARGGNLGISHR